MFENRGGVLDTAPAWSWSPANRYDLVCEALVWGDVDNSHIAPNHVSATGDGSTRLFTIRRVGPLEALDSVRVNGTVVPRAGYCHDRLGAWVSFANPPPNQSSVEFFGRVSTHPDLVITNWDPAHGSHLFLNTTPVGAAASARPPNMARLRACPNPFPAVTTVRSFTEAERLDVYDAAGRLILSAAGSRQSAIPLNLNAFAPGIYVCRTDAGDELKLVRTGR